MHLFINIVDILVPDRGRKKVSNVACSCSVQRTLKIHLRCSARTILDVAKSYNNIGIVYKNQGKYEEALVQYSRALEIKTRVLGQDHPNVADTCENIGLVLKQQGEVEKAKDKFEEAADIRRAKLGAHHALTKKSERLAANCL